MYIVTKEHLTEMRTNMKFAFFYSWKSYLVTLVLQNLNKYLNSKNSKMTILTYSQMLKLQSISSLCFSILNKTITAHYIDFSSS